MLIFVPKAGESGSKAGGISLFLVDLPQEAITYTPTPKHGFNYYKSNTVFIEDLRLWRPWPWLRTIARP